MKFQRAQWLLESHDIDFSVDNPGIKFLGPERTSEEIPKKFPRVLYADVYQNGVSITNGKTRWLFDVYLDQPSDEENIAADDLYIEEIIRWMDPDGNNTTYFGRYIDASDYHAYTDVKSKQPNPIKYEIVYSENP